MIRQEFLTKIRTKDLFGEFGSTGLMYRYTKLAGKHGFYQSIECCAKCAECLVKRRKESGGYCGGISPNIILAIFINEISGEGYPEAAGSISYAIKIPLTFWYFSCLDVLNFELMLQD